MAVPLVEPDAHAFEDGAWTRRRESVASHCMEIREGEVGGGGDKVVTCSPWGAAIGQCTLVCGNDYEVTEDDLQNYSSVCIFF